MKTGGTWDVPWNTGNYQTALIATASSSTITAGRHGATTEVKAVGVNYIMKVKQTPVPADILTKLEELLDSKQLLSWGNGT
jgi:hypothetical protein